MDSSSDEDDLVLGTDDISQDELEVLPLSREGTSTRSSVSSELTVRYASSSGEEEETTTTTPFPEVPVAGGSDFDLELPARHTYLGTDLEELSGRTLLEEGSYHTLPLLPQPGIVIVPGQTIPMTLFHSTHIKMMQNCIAKDRTFGIVCLRYVDNLPHHLTNIGTTAEIYEFHDMNVDGADPLEFAFRIKAKARQRFKIISKTKSSNGTLMAKVVILPERVLPDLLSEVRSPAMKRRYPTATNKDRICRRDAVMTAWPYWVHANYDTRHLVARVKQCLGSVLELGSGGARMVPTDPVELSFWVAQTLPLEDDERLIVVSLDSAIQRLRWELSVLENCQVFCCRNCSYKIALQSNVFSMSLEGPQNMYVNPGGYLHETLTLRRASGLHKLPVEPSTECSWFPGYAWTIVECERCREHMGWLFTAVSPGLKPKEFYGLTRRSLRMRLSINTDAEGSNIIT